MINVILVIHLLIAIVMVGLIMLQKTEGNAAGAGVGGAVSAESMMRPRARPNPIGRATTILGICFFGTSLGLALLAKPSGGPAQSIIMEPTAASGPSVPQVNEAPAATPSVPSVPAEPTAPAVPSVPNN